MFSSVCHCQREQLIYCLTSTNSSSCTHLPRAALQTPAHPPWTLARKLQSSPRSLVVSSDTSLSLFLSQCGLCSKRSLCIWILWPSCSPKPHPPLLAATNVMAWVVHLHFIVMSVVPIKSISRDYLLLQPCSLTGCDVMWCDVIWSAQTDTEHLSVSVLNMPDPEFSCSLNNKRHSK